IVGRFYLSIRRRHTRSKRDWSSDVCSSDLQHYYRIRIFIKNSHISTGNVFRKKLFMLEETECMESLNSISHQVIRRRQNFSKNEELKHVYLIVSQILSSVKGQKIQR